MYLSQRGLTAEETLGGVVVHRAACIRKHRHYTTSAELMTTLLPTYQRCAELVRTVQPDVIHTHFILPSGLLAWALSSRFDIPYVVTAHCSDVPGYNPDRFGVLHRLLTPVWQRISRTPRRSLHRRGSSPR